MPPKPRKAGLTRNSWDGGPPLTRVTRLPIPDSTSTRVKLKPVDDDAPPLSDSESEENGLSSRGDIPKSRFSGRRKPTRASTRQSNSTPIASDRETLKRLPQGIGSEDDTSDTRSQKRSKTDKVKYDGSDDLFGDDATSEQRKRGASIFLINPLKPRKTYGSRSQSNFQSNTPSAKSLKVPVGHLDSASSSPDKMGLLVAPGTPSDRKEEMTSPVHKLKVVADNDESSPASTAPPRIRPIRRRGGKQKPKDVDATPEESQRPTFKIPDLFSSNFNVEEEEEPVVANDSPLGKLKLKLSFLDSLDDDLSAIGPSVCPVCKEEVEEDLLENFKTDKPRTTSQNEQTFCHLHKTISAKREWNDKGYPNIDWRELDARIEKQYDFLKEILEGGESHYGDIFSGKVAAGQNKTLLKSEENLTPGYYGIRGLRTMSENIIREFSSLLRKRAVEDRLVSARGHTAYVQSVLVPELTVRLVMEDMKVNAKMARWIITDSIKTGELLNEEVADVVEDDDKDTSLADSGSYSAISEVRLQSEEDKDEDDD
ncbi:RTC4-like domain-containing protein [Bombardia bombarda]|uniref:Restriction of telomere capping protein 4 n=1 Tax=Bombardia bombarda TaxID=252184 RepID=A0AA39WN55_9PEZI|nr:RTC4-like domain-containing protein [Bombardia bombarda]